MLFPRESRYPGGGSAQRDQRKESGRRIRPRRRDAGAAAGPPARRSVRRKHASRGGRGDPPPARSTRRPTTRPRSEAGDRRQIPETPPRLRRGAPRRHTAPLGPSVRSEVQRLKVLKGPWAQWRERRERRGPVLPVGVRLTRRAREEYRVSFDQSATKSGAVQPGWIAARAPTGRTGPRDFVHGPLTACGGTRVSAESGQSSWWGRGARLTRRVREEYRVYFDRNATQNGAKRSGSAGMDRRSNAAWVSPQAVKRL